MQRAQNHLVPDSPGEGLQFPQPDSWDDAGAFLAEEPNIWAMVMLIGSHYSQWPSQADNLGNKSILICVLILLLFRTAEGNSCLQMQASVGWTHNNAFKGMFYLKYESQSIESMVAMASSMDFAFTVRKTQYLSVISTEGVSRLPGNWYSAIREQARHPNPVSCFTLDPVVSTCPRNTIILCT